MQKTITLLKELKADCTAEKYAEFNNHLIQLEEERQENVDPIFHSKECFDLLNTQSVEFFQYMAESFLDEITQSSVVYFVYWKPVIFDYLTSISFHKFIAILIQVAQNEDEKNFARGLKEVEKDAEIALGYFNNSRINLSSYFVGHCYCRIQGFKNSIYSFNKFEKELYSEIDKSQIDDSIELVLVVKDINKVRGYCYCRLEDYNNALISFTNAYKYFGFDNHLRVYFDKSTDFESPNSDLISIEEETEFENTMTLNYLIAIKKTKNYKLGIEICKTISEIQPQNPDYKFFLDSFNSKSVVVPKIVSDDIPPSSSNTAILVKETKQISKELNLENMIIDHIKYGFKVFNRSFKIYDDGKYEGRQLQVLDKGRLDLLLQDNDTNEIFVVELKRGEEDVNVVEQTKRYMEGVKTMLNKDVKGIICVFGAKEELKNEVKKFDDIELFKYELHFIND